MPEKCVRAQHTHNQRKKTTNYYYCWNTNFEQIDFFPEQWFFGAALSKHLTSMSKAVTRIWRFKNLYKHITFSGQIKDAFTRMSVEIWWERVLRRRKKLLIDVSFAQIFISSKNELVHSFPFRSTLAQPQNHEMQRWSVWKKRERERKKNLCLYILVRAVLLFENDSK